MNREIFIIGYPGTCGGASTEILHAVDLLRANNVDVHLVPTQHVEDNTLAHASSIGCRSHQYRDDLFADKVVAAWNNPKMLLRLPTIVAEGKPRCVVWMNCMTISHRIELKCHYAGWIDRFGFATEYQRSMLKPGLERLGPVKELEGYRQYFNPDNRLQNINFRYSIPDKEFCVGRISRDDPTKFAPDFWKIFNDVDTGKIPKRVLVCGFGQRVRTVHGNPPDGMNATLIYPDKLPISAVYDQLHCIIHKTGGSRESYCRIVPEAYAAGVPVIAERAYAFPEIIVDGETGFLCNSSEEMSERASELARDEPLRKRIIYAARDYLTTTLAPAELCWEPWRKLFEEMS